TGGPVNKDAIGAETYATVYAFAESPHEKGTLWAGSDDGILSLSRDAGKSWKTINPPDLPDWTMISCIQPSPHDKGTAYVPGTPPQQGPRLRRRPPLQPRRLPPLPLRPPRLRRHLDPHQPRHPRRRLHPRHPHRPRGPRSPLRRHRNRRLRPPRRRRQLAPPR